MSKKLSIMEYAQVLNTISPNHSKYMTTNTMNTVIFGFRKNIIQKDKKQFNYNRYSFHGSNFNVTKMKDPSGAAILGSKLHYMEQLEVGGNYSNKKPNGLNKPIPTDFARAGSGKVKPSYNLSKRRPSKIKPIRSTSKKAQMAAFIKTAKNSGKGMFQASIDKFKGIFTVKGNDLKMVYNTSVSQIKQPKMQWMKKAIKTHISEKVISRTYKKNVIKALRKKGY